MATLVGDFGDNSLVGDVGGGSDCIDGLGGNDTLDGLGGGDTLIGGTGDDKFIIDNLLDSPVENSGEGTDTVEVTSSLSTYTLPGDIERLVYLGPSGHFNGLGNASSNFISGALGNDTLIGADGADTLAGGPSDDSLLGQNGDDSVSGEGGRDIIDGGAGNDTIFGGTGDDILMTSEGFDSVIGGSGTADLLIVDYSGATAPGTLGNLNATSGSGTISINSSQVTFVQIEKFDITTGSGNDVIDVGPSILDARLVTGLGNDSVTSGSGNDTIISGSGNDTVLMGAGADTLDDALGSNSFDGGAGNDVFMNIAFNGSGGGNDTITGGSGSDRYNLNIDLAVALFADTINDFQTGTGGDVFNITTLMSGLISLPTNANPFLNGYLKLLQSGTDTLFQVDRNGPAGGAVYDTVFVLKNTTATTFTADNFAAPYNFNPQSSTGSLFTGDGNPNSLSGTPNDDTLMGNGENDTITGGGGSDSIDGGTGVDTAIFAGLRSAYSISRDANQTVTVNGTDGTDKLVNVEKFQFDDRILTLGVVRGDFNADGKSDILWQNDDGHPAIWLVNGFALESGGYIHYPDLSPTDPGPAWHVIGPADFNADGRADILLQHDNGFAAIWLVNGFALESGGFIHDSNLAPVDPGVGWTIKGEGDFDADGKSDLLWEDATGKPDIWLIDGFAMMSRGAVVGAPTLSTQWHLKLTGDFNGDGKSDILWQNDDGRVLAWLMDGRNFVASGAISTNPGPTAHPVGTGDFDGDGKADILFQSDNGQPSIFMMDGLTLASSGNVRYVDLTSANPGTAWHIKGTNDSNGDGKADILLQHDNGQPAVWLMDGYTLTSGGYIHYPDLSATNPGTAWHIEWV